MIENICPENIQVDISATAYYSCLKEATITETGTQREVTFDVSGDVDWYDQYSIYWSGSYEPIHIYAPDGTDLLQREKVEVYNSLIWGFNSLTFRPTYLANRYGLNGRGTWRIQMEVVDETVPSLYLQGGPQVSLHMYDYSYEGVSLSPGENHTFESQQIPGWYTRDIEMYLNANTSRIDVENAFLENQYWYVREDEVIEYSYWLPYEEAITVTNTGTETMDLELRFYKYFFNVIEHETYGKGLKFDLSPSHFVPTSVYNVEELRVNTNYEIPPAFLLAPDGNPADEIYLISDDRFDSIYTINGVYTAKFSPRYASEVLGNVMYGTWSLTSYPVAELLFLPDAPLVGETVTFNATASKPMVGTIQEYVWDFGDGSTGEGAVASHSFAERGTYNVTLSVTNTEGYTGTTWALIGASIRELKLEEVEVPVRELYQGESTTVTARIGNSGDFTESTKVHLYANDTLIRRSASTMIQADSEKTVTFTLSTGGLDAGRYSLRAEIDEAPGEANTDDNSLNAGTLEVIVDTEPPEISNVAREPDDPAYADEVTITAAVGDEESGLKDVELSYWDGSDWRSRGMTFDGVNYRAAIPALPYGTTCQYRVQATDNSNNSETTETYSYEVADEAPPEIDEVRSSTAEPTHKEGVTITATVAEPPSASGVQTVTLRYSVDDGAWREIGMTRDEASGPGIWRAEIPPQKGGATVSYCVVPCDNAGNTKTSSTVEYTVAKPTGLEAIPGFPYESVILGLAAGALMLWLIRRKQ